MNKILLPSRLFLAPILLFALVFALFAPSIRYPLVDLDDYAYITQNRIVIQGLTPGNVRAAFSRSNKAGAPIKLDTPYERQRPMQQEKEF